jgi:hypothetical protein
MIDKIIHHFPRLRTEKKVAEGSSGLSYFSDCRLRTCNFLMFFAKKLIVGNFKSNLRSNDQRYFYALVMTAKSTCPVKL